MSRYFESQWPPYVDVGTRKVNARHATAKLHKQGQTTSPVEIQGRAIATTVWGKAWCASLESYSDYANRLPRGRTYVRAGSVIDLQTMGGTVTARVSGTSLYRVEIAIKPMDTAHWSQLAAECLGKVGSLLTLLQGRVSPEVMAIMGRKEGGLFPKPAEIKLSCSCPDWATMCKHVAATLYGIGNRLDTKPEMLFSLRGVDPSDLVTQATPSALSRNRGSKIDDAALSDVFGIELSEDSTAHRTPARVSAAAAEVREKSSVLDETAASLLDTDDGIGAPRVQRRHKPPKGSARTNPRQKPGAHQKQDVVTKTELLSLGVSRANLVLWERSGVLIAKSNDRFALSPAGVVIVAAWRERAGATR